MDDLGRPLLRPGWQAARVDDQHLQVGLDAPARVVLADSPDVRRLLTVLADPAAAWQPPASLPAMRALDRLRAAGLLVPVPGSPLEARLAAEHGASAPARAAARRAARVSVQAPPEIEDALASLLRAEGVRPVTSAASLTVVAALGPVRRGRLDPLLQDGRPHLVVSGGPGRWEVGPFVVPGRTACLRCVDAALAETEPRRAMVADQLARSPVPVPVSPSLQAAALGLAAREVLAYVDGERPAAWSATLVLGPTGPPEVRDWARHPLCGCAWDVVLADELT
jgi:non-ribosomal peptide synthetase component F